MRNCYFIIIRIHSTPPRNCSVTSRSFVFKGIHVRYETTLHSYSYPYAVIIGVVHFPNLLFVSCDASYKHSDTQRTRMSLLDHSLWMLALRAGEQKAPFCRHSRQYQILSLCPSQKKHKMPTCPSSA